MVAPTLADPAARSASRPIGGPLGRHARTGQSWWSPLRVVLAVATVMFGLGIVQKSPCVVGGLGAGRLTAVVLAPVLLRHPILYVHRGLGRRTSSRTRR